MEAVSFYDANSRPNCPTEDFQHLSRGDLIDLCAAMQKNLRTAKSAFSEERSAVKALRKELQHERVSRSAVFSKEDT